MKIKELIEYAKANNINKDFEIEGIYYLLMEKLNINRSSLLIKLNNELDNELSDLLMKDINRYILDSYPVQYITNTSYFYGNKYFVNDNVLIPRFDTEVVVEKAIEEIRNDFKDQEINIVDVGTGSGIIAITLKDHFPRANVYAIDISLDALEVAKINAKNLNQDIIFINNDLLTNQNLRYDVIISNPPYISDDEYVMDMVRNNEPNIALFSGDNGLYHYKKIIMQSINLLKDNGIIIFEISDNKCDELHNFVKRYYKNIKIYLDYNNQRRVMVIKDKIDE